MINRGSVYKIPYFRALKIWNESQSPLRGEAWVIPYGPKKISPLGSTYHQEINKIREGQVGYDPNISPNSFEQQMMENYYISPIRTYPSSTEPEPQSISPLIESPKTPIRSQPSTEYSAEYKYISPIKTPSRQPSEKPIQPDEKPKKKYEIGDLYPSEQPSYDISSDMEIKKSTIPDAGLGVFTKVPLSKGMRIGIYTGTIISEEEQKKSKSNAIITLNVPYKIYVDGNKDGNWTSRINHQSGAGANVEWNKMGTVIVKKKINPGTELFINYGPDAKEIIKMQQESKSKTKSSPKNNIFEDLSDLSTLKGNIEEIKKDTNKRPAEDNYKQPEAGNLYKNEHHYTYVREGRSNEKKIIKYNYEIDVPNDLKIPSKVVTLGTGSYATVVKGEWKNKPCAIKFQILDAPIPQASGNRVCAMKEDSEKENTDCFYMSDKDFNEEEEYILFGGRNGISPIIYNIGKVPVLRVTTLPQIKNQLMPYPTHLGMIIMEYLEGKTLYEALRTEGPMLRKRKDYVIQQILEKLHKLWNNNARWNDMHFGNILLNRRQRVIFIDIGDCSKIDKTKLPWDNLKFQYLEKINTDWNNAIR